MGAETHIQLFLKRSFIAIPKHLLMDTHTHACTHDDEGATELIITCRVVTESFLDHYLEDVS